MLDHCERQLRAFKYLKLKKPHKYESSWRDGVFTAYELLGWFGPKYRRLFSLAVQKYKDLTLDTPVENKDITVWNS